MKVTFSFLYNRKKKLNNRGEAAIEIRAYYNGKNKIISTKTYVTPSQWDNEKRIVNHPNQIHLNLKLQKQIDDLERLQTDYILRDKVFNLKILTELLNGKDKIAFTTFIQFPTCDIPGYVQALLYISHKLMPNRLLRYIHLDTYNAKRL
ncbi:MAG: hypothetical protein COC01_04985 [Bacteroidetes bacterium]|nr:hypothetical protein [Bacteroidia bacterium]PCH67853.1 MAG: hypothetical protein COC01_04985 [Bacteroidota bacterium]